MVDDHTVWTLYPLHLMSHQIATLVVHIVGNYKPICKEIVIVWLNIEDVITINIRIKDYIT